ncbi:MAG TPA: hypothetical protein VGR69_06275 [Candidatus Rubrimentiphilum sp.]|nr:hypothetical protein [Candidatus Rubrimentiphilum sp.]
MPRPSALISAGALPAALALLVLTGCGNGKVIGSGPLPTPTPLVPSVSAEFTVPTSNSSPTGITSGADGFLYIAERGGNNIAQMSTGGSFKEFAVPTGGSAPFGIVATTDGNLWFTENAGDKIGELTPSSSTFTELPIPTASSGPTYITLGPDGALWFSETAANKIGRLTLTGVFTEFAVPTPNAGLAGLSRFPSDNGLYIVETNASQIVRFDTTALTFGTPVPTITANAGPTQIVVCPDLQALCFTEDNVAKLGRMTPGGVMTEFSLSPATSANALVDGADFNIYFSDRTQNKIGRVSGTTFSSVKEFSITTANSQPSFMSLGSDGEVYFTETAANKIGRLTYF